MGSAQLKAEGCPTNAKLVVLSQAEWGAVRKDNGAIIDYNITLTLLAQVLQQPLWEVSRGGGKSGRRRKGRGAGWWRWATSSLRQ